MSLRFLDGWDHYATAQILSKWTLGAGSPLVAQGAGRESGGNALALGLSSSVRKVLTNESTWTFGCAFQASGYPTGSGIYHAGLQDSLNLYAFQITWGINTSGYFIVSVGATIYTSTTQIPLNTWTYVELQATISPSAGSFTLKVNGTAVLTETGIDTQGSTTTNTDTVALGPYASGSTGACYYDDFYICDANGSHNTGFLGNITVQALWPLKAGTNTQWTGSPSPNNFANVNDPVPDDDESVNQTSTTGDMDSYNFTQVRPQGATIVGIQHCITARSAAGTSHTLSPLEYTGGTAYADTAQTLTSGYTCLLSPHDTDPATGSAFTEAGVNGAEFGFRLVS